MHCFMRSPEKTENYEYCITVPRSFVGLQYQAQPSFFRQTLWNLATIRRNSIKLNLTKYLWKLRLVDPANFKGR